MCYSFIWKPDTQHRISEKKKKKCHKSIIKNKFE